MGWLEYVEKFMWHEDNFISNKQSVQTDKVRQHGSYFIVFFNASRPKQNLPKITLKKN